MDDGPQRLDGVRVLLVDDHADTRDLYRLVLVKQGATVTATSGAEVAARVLGTVDIVVTDLAMPGPDGIWLLEQARAQTPGVPVIGISGFSREQTRRLETAAFDLLLLKPIDPWDLGDRIAEVLRRQRRAVEQ